MKYDPVTCSFQCEGCGEFFEVPRRVAWDPHAKLVMLEALSADHRLCQSVNMLDLYELVAKAFGVKSVNSGGRGVVRAGGGERHSSTFSPYLEHHRASSARL